MTVSLTLDSAVLSAFTLLWLVVVPTPGANSLMVTRVAMTRPSAHVPVAILDNMGGILLLALGALVGWAAVLATFPWLRLTVQILGGVYLIHFGWRLALRSRTPPAAGGSPLAEGGTGLSVRSSRVR
jgi:threonine efflux protein